MTLDEARQSQPMPELERKARKASRRSLYTQEDLDLVKARAADMPKQIAFDEQLSAIYADLAAQQVPLGAEFEAAFEANRLKLYES